MRLAAVVIAALSAPFLTPGFSRQSLAVYSEEYVDIPLLLLTSYVFVRGLPRLQHPERQRFGWLIGAAMFVWSLNVLLYWVVWEFIATPAGSLLTDAIYFAYYLLIALAIELRPDRPPGWTRDSPVIGMRLISTAVLVFATFIYFVIIPSAVNAEVYDTWLPSVFMFLALDLYLLLRFLGLRSTARSRVFRVVYSLFAVAIGGFLLSDLAEYLSLAGVFEVPSGTLLDLAWLLPYPPLVLAARLSHLPAGDEERQQASEHTPPSTLRAVAPQVAVAFLIPVTHLTMYGAGLLDPESERIRSWLLIAFLLALGALVLVQQELLEGRNSRLHRELEESRERLQLSHRLEAIGRLAGGIAHDFNNLLTVIAGCSELALARLRPDEPARSDVESIREAGERASSLTTQLLAFSSQQVLKPQVLDVNEIIRGFEPLLRRTIGEDLEVSIQLAKGATLVHADPGQLEQVLLNLSINARSAMPDGGTLTIETSYVSLHAEEPVADSSIAPGDYVLIAVSDTGFGMDEETRRRVFEPFFTTREAGEGTGLGLAVVYGIVKQSMGHIWASSEPGNGTTFNVYLPAAAAGEAPAAVARRPRPTRGPGGTESILLVEDEEGVRDFAARALRDHGYRVLSAAGPAEARRILVRQAGAMDLVVTDMVMPGGTGQELGRWLARHHPGVRVLYISGYPAGVAYGPGKDDVGEDFLWKPFSVEALTTAVRRLLDEPGPAVGGSADAAT